MEELVKAKDVIDGIRVYSDPEHNPANLTDEQVERKDGWRLLRKSEVGSHQEATQSIEKWDVGGWDDSGWSGSSHSMTYRTKLTPEELAKLP